MILVILLAIPIGLHAEPGKPLNDPLLDKLVGDWSVERKMGSGRIARNTVHVEWVLQHQFVELHYRDAAAPPTYEAIVLIGYDEIGKHYICHWADNFGGSYSTDGFAPREEGSTIEFKFEFHDGQLTNRYTFDPKTAGGPRRSGRWRKASGSSSAKTPLPPLKSR